MAPGRLAWSLPIKRDATGKVVRGFRSQYTVHVQNGVLRAEHKSHPSQRGYSSWLRIDGKIQPDGSADLRVNGLSGDPIYSPAGEKPGTPYNYEVRAHFAGNYGTGNSVGFRIHNFTFARSSFGN